MRVALRRKSNRGAVGTVVSTPAPVGGWNVRDSIAGMDPKDAVILDNWFPTASDVRIRKGSASWATGLTTVVETLMTYKPQNPALDRMFSAVATKIYDTTVTGAVGAAAVSSLTNGRWQYVNMTTAGGHFLLAVNGADKLQNFDGTNWTAVDGSSTYAITGVTTTTLVGINVFKSRIFLIPTNSTKFWYLPIASIGGAAVSFELGSVFKNGGFLVSMGTWSVQTKTGFDDYAVFLSSTGEVAVYSGTDPGSAVSWNLMAMLSIGAPIGLDSTINRRCMVKVGGELLIITNNGVVPLSGAIPSFGLESTTGGAITDKIRDAMSTAASLYGANFGWSLTLFPAAGMLLLNVPTKEGLEQHQYVMNLITKSWCRFRGWNANCFVVHKERLFFGGVGTVYEAWVGTNDVGTNIPAELVQAFNAFGARGRLKNFLLCRPIFSWDTPPVSLTVNFDVDYKVQTPEGEISLGGVAGGLWDAGLWDTARWGGGQETQGDWLSVSGLGHVGSLHVMVQSRLSTLSFANYDTRFESGDGI